MNGNHLSVSWGCVEIANHCRAGASRQVSTITGWVPVDPVTSWRPGADIADLGGSCLPCCDCAPTPGIPDDADNPAPWYDPDRPESVELWAIQPRMWEPQSGFVVSEGSSETQMGFGRCTVGNWLLTVDLYGSETGRRYGLAWLHSLFGVCDTCPSCEPADLEIEAVCGVSSTIRDARVTVFRTVESDNECVTRVEIMFESPDTKLWQETVWLLDEADPWELICNPDHPLNGMKCDCPDTIVVPSYVCPTVPEAEYPGDSTQIGCAVTAGDGDDSPLTNVVVSPQDHTVFDLTAAIPDLVAPLTIVVSGAPTAGVVTPGAKSVVWSGLANNVGGHRVALTVTDADGKVCPVALGVLVLPCCDPVKTVGPQNFEDPPNLTKNGDVCVDPAPPITECYYPAVVGGANWKPSPAVRCIQPGDTVDGWVAAWQHYGPNGHGVGVAPYAPAEIRVPIPVGVASWSWTVTAFSGATFSGPAAGTSSTDIVVPGVVLPSGPGFAHGAIFIEIIPTHDGSDNDFGDITSTISGGGLEQTATGSGSSPPICACAPTDCGCDDAADLRHGTIVSVDDNAVAWSVPEAFGPITSVSTPAFGAVTTIGSDVVWLPTGVETAAWSDAVTVELDGCFAVLVNHHTATVAADPIVCGTTIIPPTVQVPDVCPVVEACPDVQINHFCLTVPAIAVGGEIVIEIETDDGAVDGLITEWAKECSWPDFEKWWCWEPDGIRQDNFQTESVIEISGRGAIVSTLDCMLKGQVPVSDKCNDTLVCFTLPVGSTKPSRVRVGQRRWLL